MPAAFGISLTGTAYIGEWASRYWLPNIFAGNTISQGVVNVEDGIKGTPGRLIGNLDFAGGLQPRQAEPQNPNGVWTIGNKYLSPNPAMLYTTFNPAVFEGHWENVNLSKEMLQRKLPATIESYMMYQMMGRVFQESMETGWWMSSTAYQAITDTTDSRYYNQFFDGFMKLLILDNTVLTAPSPVTLTNANLLMNGSTPGFMDVLIGLIATNKKGLISKFNRMRFVMSPYTYTLFRQALLALVYKGIQPDEKAYLKYAGYKIAVCNGFPDNSLLFAELAPDFNGALHIGLNSKDDENEIQMAKTLPQNETYFIKALLKLGVQYKFGNEIALMTTLTSASFTYTAP